MTDPYVDSNGVLKNKLNIKTSTELEQAEADIGFLKLINIDSVHIDYFDATLLKDIHKHIFGEIFDWAGEYRTVPLVKAELVLPGYSIPYSAPSEIEDDLREHIHELNSMPWHKMSTEQIATTFARKMALLWKVHPFRDGNTRTMLCYAYLYAKEHGFPFDMKTFTDGLSRVIEDNRVKQYSVRDKFVLASLDEKDYPEVEHLAKVFEQAIANNKGYDISKQR